MMIAVSKQRRQSSHLRSCRLVLRITNRITVRKTYFPCLLDSVPALDRVSLQQSNFNHERNYFDSTTASETGFNSRTFIVNVIISNSEHFFIQNFIS